MTIGLKKKILSVVGARPQFIKLSPLSKILSQDFKEVIVHTGQHYDENMSDLFFKELDITPPDYNLDIGSWSHGSQTGKMMIKLEEIVLNEKPDLVIVYGDTNSTLAGSLITSKLNIETVHIEAGLRSFNKSMPEEVNRIISDHVSNFLFVPTLKAKENLSREGIKDRVYVTGDIMVDSVLSNKKRAVQRSGILKDLELEGSEFYLCTLHRPYNVDNPDILKSIINQLGTLQKKIVFPVHPRTKQQIDNIGLQIPDNFVITNPLGYLDFICLQNNSSKIITDSGGIQKEAYILKIPCITLRTETEWVETVEIGWNKLIKPESKDIAEQIENFSPPGIHNNLYGYNVAEKMGKIIKEEILNEG